MEKSVKKKKLTVPHSFALLFLIIVICTVLTWIVPAGEFATYEDPKTGVTYLDPDNFNYIESSPVSLFEMFGAVPRGMISAADIIFFLFIVGGAFGVIEGTGAFAAGIGSLVKRLEGREIFLISVLTAIFAIGGSLFGLAEQGLALIPVAILLTTSLGLDRIVAVAIIVAGSQAGFSSGIFNPFTTAVGHKMADLPLYSGKGFRLVGLIVFTGITIWYLARYIKKIKANPELSLVHSLEDENLIENFQGADADLELTTKHKAALATLVVAVVILAYGVAFHGWYLMELSYLFFGMGIVAGLVGGSGMNKTAEDFVKGATSLTMGALIVGFARGIVIVLQDGKILDTIIKGLSTIIMALPNQITVLGMYIVQVLVNFLIPSGSGQAAATLPIMLPLGDMAGITRQVSILVMEYGNGLSNAIYPTVGLCIGAVGIAKVPYEKWVKWALPLMGLWHLAGAILLLIANAIQLGPF